MKLTQNDPQKIDVLKRAATACVLSLLILALCCQCAEVEIREDFQGTGNFQTSSNYEGIKAGVLTRDATSITYGHIFSPAQSFVGLKAQGGEKNSYLVATRDHFLSIREAGAINATAKFSTQNDRENTTRFTLFTAQGEGKVREMVLTLDGNFSRPVELSGLWHSGPFKLNSSVRVKA